MTSSDIKDLLDSLYGAFASGDASAWEDSLGEGTMCIGTDEAEWWQGREGVLPALKAQFAEMSATGIRVTPGVAAVTDRGDYVLVADRPTLHLADGSSTVLRPPTPSVSRSDGSLGIEQMHLSVPAPNEAVVKQSLTV